MTTTDIMASAAITMAITAMLASIIAIPVLFQKGADLRYQLTEGMSEFRVMTDDTWARMMSMRTVKGIKARPARQSTERCKCYAGEFLHFYGPSWARGLGDT